MKSLEGSSAGEIISNMPELMARKIDPDNFEHQKELIRAIQEFIVSDEQFRNQIKPAEVSLQGISSVVTFIETEQGKFVLKVPLSPHSNAAEPVFFNQWEKCGVKVPHILREGTLAGRPYWVMPFIEGETVSHSLQNLDAPTQGEILQEMGKTLRQMHESIAERVGVPFRNERGEFGAPHQNFESWIESSAITHAINQVKVSELLNNEHGSIEKALVILNDYTKRNDHKTYCHWDYSLSNIFYTKPLTIFDPNPMFNYGIIDLGRAMFINMTDTGLGHTAVEELEKGYFGVHDTIEPQVKHASILLAAYMKISFWSKMRGSRIKKIARAQTYLSEHKKLLD